MRLPVNISYILTDRRSKVTLVASLFIALLLGTLMKVVLDGAPTVTGYIAVGEVAAGDVITEANTHPVTLIQSEVRSLACASSIDGLVATRHIPPGALIVDSSVETSEDYLVKSADQRFVTLKLGIADADGWLAFPGDVVDLIHVDPQQLNPLKIMTGIVLHRLIWLNDRETFPSFAVLLVTEAQREYITSNRHVGRFELSH